MRKIRINSLLIGLLACVLAGCATAPHRARQYSEDFAALPKETQKRAQLGYIREGDSMEAVYIAMGAPQAREKIRDTDGIIEDHWIYIGHPSPGQDLLEPGNYSFTTVNDVSWSNPFSGEQNQRIHIVFLGETVLRVDIEDNDGTAIKRPNMVKPSL